MEAEETKKDITEELTPRNYQISLMEIALKQNTIIFLPTGAGKTFIAVMVLKRLGEALLKPYGDGGKISFILVNNVALVEQHAKYVRDHTVFTVGHYSGELKTDFWKKQQWEQEFTTNNVLVMTSQIFENILTCKFIDLAQVNLIIFDECHRGVIDHPMRRIMMYFQNFQNRPEVELPRVLGLTATLLNANCKLMQLMEQVQILETTFHSQVATVDGLGQVVGYSTNPREKTKFCRPVEITYECGKAIMVMNNVLQVLNRIQLETQSTNARTVEIPDSLEPLSAKNVLKDLKKLVQDLIFHMELMGPFGAYKSCIVYMIQTERVKRHCEDIIMYYVLNYVVTSMSLAKDILKNSLETFSDLDKLYKCCSDKIVKLFEIFKEYKELSKEELCGLIFVNRRNTAKIIHHVLSSAVQHDPELAHIKPNFMVGAQNNPYKSGCESLFISKKNKEILGSFRSKEINILVTSNMLEEGVDIPKCTLVVKFDKPVEYRSYIQSKGRARHCESLYYILVEIQDSSVYMNQYQGFQKIENALNDYLIGKNELRDSPSRKDIDKMYNEDQIPPYFANGPNSAQVNMVSATPRLMYYCQNFPSDQYTIHAPEWYLENDTYSDKCRVLIYMPTICPITEPIIGPFMDSKKNAKRGAALYACIALHKCGELDDNLLPVQRKISQEDLSYLFSHWPEVKEDRAGIKKKRRLHEIQVADCLRGGFIPGNNLYLHMIVFDPQYPKSENFNEGLVYDMLTNPLRFGLISPKPLPPKLPNFPLYDSKGEIRVEVKTNVKTLKLSQEQLTMVKQFHFLIFNDLLEILKEYLILDNEGQNAEMLLVVPIQAAEEVSVDFSVMEEHKCINSRHEPKDRSNLNLSEESYLHKIISPWYRNQTSMYLVVRVATELNPKSRFPEDDFQNFAQYYEQKHDLKVLNNDQPLLLVRSLPQGMNTFKPKGRETKRKREKRYLEAEEYLIPEFVVKQDFPAILWIQSRFLPCILWRLVFMLKLHQLQDRIGKDLKADMKISENCPNLELDHNLLDYDPGEEDKKQERVLDAPTSTSGDILQLKSSMTVANSYNKDYAMKLLESEFPWKNIDEPKDIERTLNVNVMDIELYEQFVSRSPSKPVKTLQNNSALTANRNLPALTYPEKDFEEKHLLVLRTKYNQQIPNLCEFYQSLTTAEANDIVNLERLETLGDSFLKLISSLYIMQKYPMYTEGKATALKGIMVSNKNLYYLAARKHLGGILQNRAFMPSKDWTPPSFCVPYFVVKKINDKEASINSLFWCRIPEKEQVTGVLEKETVQGIEFQEIVDDEENSYPSMCHFINRNYVGDKSVADCVEALIGAHFQTGGFEGGIKFLEWMGFVPPSENIQRVLNQPAPNPLREENMHMHISRHIPQWAEFENRLGYKFENRGYLLQALTHASYSCNRITTSYERLEFIGDAVLDFLITCYIYEHCGYLNPGEITDLRSALVNNNTFASLVVRCGFHKFLLLMNTKLQGHIDKFSEYLATKNYVIDDEVLILLQEEDLNLAEYVDVPKALGDVFEAIAGAVYLDSGKNLEVVWRVFYKIMWKEIDLFSKDVPKNIIRRLFECHQAYPAFSKEVQLESGMIMVAVEFMCEGRKKRVHGFGTNKTAAKRAASKMALRSLNLQK